ncbi:hypothetical protein PO909_015636 [Leuciscus waleckii]
MKPRRRLTSVDLLPTIAELQESELQQSLDEYMDSIRELSQPTYPLSGPLQGSRLPPLRMAKYPSMSLAHKPYSKGPDSSNQEPLDWLFLQAQHGGAILVTVVLLRHTGHDLFNQKRMWCCCQADL